MDRGEDDSCTSVSDDEEEEDNFVVCSLNEVKQIVHHSNAVNTTHSQTFASTTVTSSLSSCDTQKDKPILDEQQTVSDLQQFEKDKKAVYKHPLFPLLALLLEKCEYATGTLNMNDDNVAPSSFNAEMQAFVQHQQRDGKPFLSEDPEVDSLMIKAIQVLRIHLLELEKVQELCKDFCQRYITCLRTKMNSENLLRGATGVVGNASFDGSSCSSGSSDEASSGPLTFPSVNSSNAKVYQMVQTSQGVVAQPLPVTSSNQLTAPNSTTVSQAASIDNDRLQTIAPRVDSGNEGDLSDDASNTSNKKIQKRGVLPKHATSVMRSWLFQHIVHPYPTEDEKRAIAAQTNLTLLQVNNWFINARRRILQPMLDSANALNNSENSSQNSSSKNGNLAKKLKTCNKNASLQRFWPESVASAIQANTVNKESESK
ncbi:Homeobox protein PKNOX2-like protein [Dinothrombium tinctorium]|uniref:Homeobox protein PKNOX2-like protein n=1 Tax=Dinothrombium tinctorium TaxID=1965070 RepID=A0A3S3PGJ5_9ACAR|nr:Homeobox protein PKNOX2-like protein [Dinothrombium tinctorium]